MSLLRVPEPSRVQALGLLVAGALALPGLLPGARGALDPETLLVWLALLSVPAGVLVGGLGVPPWPYGLAVPGAWALVLVAVTAGSAGAPGSIETPLWAVLAWTGLFGLGSALGALLVREPGGDPRRALGGAGVAALLVLALAGLAVQGGVTDGSRPWAAERPRLAALALDLSPVALVLDCSGLDWTHANPRVYRVSGVEWFVRRPVPAPLAATTSVVVGCLLAEWIGRRRRSRSEG